ncbi:calcium/proton exchanger [Pseudomonas sp.]|uniref:calcium/proton exchanger n=1 Tax=Pseudomonas sp. TaxID=306 RepID=UPI0025FC12C4|nr:calcium/proton exchanger [Pseudomonas sp.]
MKNSVAKLVVPLGALAVLPIAPLLAFFFEVKAPWIFLAGAIAIGVLADWVRRSTEHLAARVGPAIGGLLNVSFGSLAELILAFFVLVSGNVDVVRAQITGSIIGTGLFGFGLAVMIGSVGRRRLKFNRAKAGQMASLLILVTIALLLPAVFDFTSQHLTGGIDLSIADEQLSIGVSVVLLLLYVANLIYTLRTHKDMFAPAEPREPSKEQLAWPLWLSVFVLIIATAFIALEADLVSGALEETAETIGVSPTFIGVIVLALVGTASDLFAASWFAAQGRMNLVLNICIGSAIQVALVVAPLLVIGSWMLGHPMSLVFDNPLDLFAIASAAFILNSISSDGEVTWFEGLLLVGVYVVLAMAFFFSPSAPA